MPQVLLLTAEWLPAGAHDFDTQVLGSALADRGGEVTVLPWSVPMAGGNDGVDLAVIRTTWDYTFRLQEFLTTIESFPVPVANPPVVVRWNAHKGYLVDLDGQGVAVVPTELIRRGEPASIPRGAERIIVKPASSAGARGVGLFDADSPAALDHLRDLLERGDALVQPFEPSVHDGERSLIYLGGSYSHAVRKVPVAGDFRVQTRYGGRVLPHQATGAELDVADAALDRIAEPLLYARVDLIGSPQRPLLMELELIEPELFLPTCAESAGRLADVILGWL